MPQSVVTEGRDLAAPVEEEPAVDPMAALLERARRNDPIALLGDCGYLGTREEIEAELDVIAAAIRMFYRKTPDQVMRESSAYTARLTELAVLLHRVEGSNRQYTRIRTQQVERFIAELDRQFRTASRLIEVQRQDIDMLRGQV